MDLSLGFDTFVKHDGSKDEHLDSLLKAIVSHEQETGTKIDANIVTWRGMMTKVRTCLPLMGAVLSGQHRIGLTNVRYWLRHLKSLTGNDLFSRLKAFT